MVLPLVSLNNLTLARGLRVLVQDLTFDLKPGDIWSLTGVNGAGKTSLLRAAAKLFAPFSGQVQWADGVGVAFLGHELALKPHLRPRALVSAAALERWALQDLADVPCALLSAGQKKRLALANRCESGAQVWLFDEPFANLDSRYAAMLRGVVIAHCRSGGASLCCVHRPELPGGTLTLDEGRAHISEHISENVSEHASEAT